MVQQNLTTQEKAINNVNINNACDIFQIGIIFHTIKRHRQMVALLKNNYLKVYKYNLHVKDICNAFINISLRNTYKRTLWG